MSDARQNALNAAIAAHSRNWRGNRYVYPVCSRRGGGISIGVNLSPDLGCTFDCIYCQVDRKMAAASRSKVEPVDLAVLLAELTAAMADAQSGRLLTEPEFRDLPDAIHRVNDIAFSGNGEATASPRFADAVELADELVAAAAMPIKLVLITNASLLDRPAVRRGLQALHRHNGEVWGKLDASTEDYFARVARTAVPLERIIANLTWSASRWPIVIQTCFNLLAGVGPAELEIAAYCDRLASIVRGGGRIKLVQVHTIARPPAEDFVRPLSRQQIDAIVETIRRRHPAIPVQAFYGLAAPPADR